MGGCFSQNEDSKKRHSRNKRWVDEEERTGAIGRREDIEREGIVSIEG